MTFPPRPVVLIAGFALLLLVLVLLRPLLPIDETRYLAVAWEMRVSGDPVHLTRNFELYTHKPPLLFWLMNLVWLATGVGELAARLVGPADAVAVMAMTGWLGRALWPEDAGLPGRAMAMLAGFTAFVIYTSATMFDALLALAVLAGIGALWRIGTGTAGRGPWLALGLAMALGVYAKGPVVLVHLALPLLAMRLWAPAPPRLPQILRGFGLALLVGFAVVALWLVPAVVTGDAAYRHELLWTQSAARVAGGMRHDRAIWFLVALLPVLLFPWAWSWRLLARLPATVRGAPAGRLCALWAVGALVAFSLISSKQAHYLVPEFPAMALLFARAMPVPAGQGARGGAAAALIVALLGAALVAAGAGFMGNGGALGDIQRPSALIPLGALALGLAVLGWRLPLLPGHLALGAGVALVFHIAIAATGLGAAYDARLLARRLAPGAEAGLAYVGGPWNAEANFALRLTRPVATPESPEALAAWAVAHPGGLVFGRVETAGIAAPPAETLRYGGRTLGIWPAVSVRE